MLTGLAPIARKNARILILGSMPVKASLQAGRYYVHPRNLFWDLLFEVTGSAVTDDYAARCNHLHQRRIALWDVVHRCQRSGSLDSAIDSGTVETNDFAAFLGVHRRIHTIFFNGIAAQTLFHRHVLPAMTGSLQSLYYHRLPSTSPANASWPRQRKLAAWHAIRDALEQ